LDILSYAMYPTILEDYRRGTGISLVKSLSKALKAINTVIAFAFAIFIYGLLVSVAIAPIFLIGYINSNIAFLALSFILISSALIAFSVFAFFVVPEGVVESFKQSAKLGFKHRWDLIKINIFFALIAIATLYLVFVSELSGPINIVSIAAYILVRLMQAVVYTYLSLVNPAAYFSVKDY
jgi:hypothetical protein